MTAIIVTTVAFVTAALLWLIGCQCYRGRPRTSHKMSFILGFACPLGCIVLLVAGLFCINHERDTVIKAWKIHNDDKHAMSQPSR